MTSKHQTFQHWRDLINKLGGKALGKYEELSTEPSEQTTDWEVSHFE